MNTPLEDISKFLDGSLDAQKSAALELWRETSPENEKYFQEIAYVWKNSSKNTTQNTEVLTIDTEQALRQVNDKIESAKIVKLKPRFNIMAIASSVALLIAAIFTFQYLTKAPSEIRIVAENGQQITLPDESTIWLEPGALVSYLPTFGEGRQIDIEGEVFVDVKRNEDMPFIVQSPHMTTEVLGTSFVIQDKKANSESHVTVLSGKVKVTATESNKHVLLMKDMTAMYDVRSKKLNITESPISANHLFEATQELRFTNTTLNQLFNQLEIFTNSEIELNNNALIECPFTGQFNTDNVEIILQRIQPIYNFTIVSKAGKYIISGGSCN